MKETERLNHQRRQQQKLPSSFSSYFEIILINLAQNI